MQRGAVAQPVIDVLHDDGIGALAEPGEQPIAGLVVAAGPRDARPEPHLVLDVAERPLPVEPAGGAPATMPRPSPAPPRLALARRRQEPDERYTAEVVEDLFHLICPTLVLS